ncbi:MAG: hypothetical protein F6K56_36375, partial [Moorea sp. SIO3G5]|nr:hypothetical protein [Moorena sp. SIO3G5]
MVEQASCLLQFPGASWWNRHLACILTQADKMPTPLIFIPPLSNAKNLDLPQPYCETLHFIQEIIKNRNPRFSVPMLRPTLVGTQALIFFLLNLVIPIGILPVLSYPTTVKPIPQDWSASDLVEQGRELYTNGQFN